MLSLSPCRTWFSGEQEPVNTKGKFNWCTVLLSGELLYIPKKMSFVIMNKTKKFVGRTQSMHRYFLIVIDTFHSLNSLNQTWRWSCKIERCIYPFHLMYLPLVLLVTIEKKKKKYIRVFSIGFSLGKVDGDIIHNTCSSINDTRKSFVWKNRSFFISLLLFIPCSSFISAIFVRLWEEKRKAHKHRYLFHIIITSGLLLLFTHIQCSSPISPFPVL